MEERHHAVVGVDEADAARIAYIADILARLGVPPAQARTRAFVVYSLVLAESLVAAPDGAAERAERRRLIEALALAAR